MLCDEGFLFIQSERVFSTPGPINMYMHTVHAVWSAAKVNSCVFHPALLLHYPEVAGATCLRQNYWLDVVDRCMALISFFTRAVWITITCIIIFTLMVSHCNHGTKEKAKMSQIMTKLPANVTRSLSSKPVRQKGKKRQC